MGSRPALSQEPCLWASVQCFAAAFSVRSSHCLTSTERGVLGVCLHSAWSRGAWLWGCTATEQIEPPGLWQLRAAKPPATHPCRRHPWPGSL